MTVDQSQTESTNALTIDQFLEKLDSVQHAFVWSFERHRRSGVERRAHARFRIRCSVLRGPAEGQILSPVQALCHALTGKVQNEKEAGQTVGLSRADTDNLIAASNHETWRDRDGRRQPDEHLEWLRMRLLEIVEDEVGRNN